MKQLVLDIGRDGPRRFENFVVGSNEALVAALHEVALAGAGPLYLWGPAGSGRSHLLEACGALAMDSGRTIARWTDPADRKETADLLLVDDVEGFDPVAQVALFNAFNRAPAEGHSLVVAGGAPPRDLALREDLRTRIGQCLGFELQPFDDDTRRDILRQLAERRGFRLDDEVLGFLLRHGRRDLPNLLAVLDALDTASLEHKRPITLPLLRRLMQGGLDLSA
ncbi:MAG: DnaA regulatory inactivator Hda [Rhodocyclaceae bacterium]|nr:DnaA regulatory inactivator Hda [Rhodocyclaceae bacterium]